MDGIKTNPSLLFLELPAFSGHESGHRINEIFIREGKALFTTLVITLVLFFTVNGLQFHHSFFLYITGSYCLSCIILDLID